VEEELLDDLCKARTRVVLAFSRDEPMTEDLARSGTLARLPRWPNVELVSLPTRDHKPSLAQRAVHALADRELDRIIRAALHTKRDLSQRGDGLRVQAADNTCPRPESPAVTSGS